MKYYLFNPRSGSGDARERAELLRASAGDDVTVVDMTGIASYADFASALTADDTVVIFGGDGTLNRFINGLGDSEVPCAVEYMPTGSGNDFAIDIGMGNTDMPVDITEYIKNLPTVEVDGKTSKFINGVGYGIDGYCCEVGDELKLKGKKPNYTMIAISGLLFHYKPCDAVVTVDGVEHIFKKVWIAPTMYGAHYGGGMMPTPMQKRDSDKLSLMVFHGSNKLVTLMIFPNIFNGEHVKSTKYITVLEGKEIAVKFTEPRALQIDGETVLGVTSYTAKR